MNLLFTEQLCSVRARVYALQKHSQFRFLMRVSLFYFFLVMLSMQLLLANPGNSQGLEDSITLEVRNGNLKEVFKKIEKQTGLFFAYQPHQVNAYTAITIEKSTRSIKDFLDLVLENTSLTYQKVNESVIIFKKPEGKENITDPVAEQTSDAEIVLSGRVIDKETNLPLPGVSVYIKGTVRGTVTDSDGKYSIDVNDGDVLVFSFIGFVTYETPIEGRATIDVSLESSIKSLDEVVIIGYGTTTRRLSTGSISKVSSSDIANQPVTNVLQALQGRMPGVSVTQANGLPGAGFTVQIRGENSLTRVNQPLYIVDGVPYLSTPINVQSQPNPAVSGSVLSSAEGNTSPLNSINPADIESIEILKDADATAIYGSRAANGVVLISTKKGKPGKTMFTVSASTGASQVPHTVEMLSTQEYLRLRALGNANAGVTSTVANSPDLMVWDQNANIDFQKLLTSNTARTSDITASLSGGDRRTTFLISGTFHKENNVFTSDQGYRRGALNLNANHTTENDKLQVGVSVIYNGDKNDISMLDLMPIAYYMPPNFPLYKDDGTLYWTGTFSGPSNPLGNYKRVNENKTTNMIGSLNVRYTILPGLDFKTMLGFSRTDMDQMQLTPMAAQDPGISSNQTRAFFTYNVTHNYIVEPQVTYSRNIWKGKLDALAGGTWQFQNSKQPFYVSASGFLSDEFITNIGSATTKSVSSTSAQYKYASLFGRLTYNIENKYIANVSFRRDGSSRFGPSNKFGNFGSVGAAWIFSEESFMKNSGLPWLTFGKLRGSYGVVGSDNIRNYQYLETFATNTYVYNGVTGLVPNQIANSEFQWEETKKLEGALELGFWNDRLIATAAYYRNRTDNQLLSFPISTQTGFSSYQANLPAEVQNAGWEFTLSSNNIQKDGFTWSTNVNFSHNANKLLSYPNLKTSPYANTYEVGKPFSSYRMYKYTGLSEATGLPVVEDRDGSGTITAADRYYRGPRAPKFFGGITNTVSWKGFTLDFTFQFVKQKGLSMLYTSYVPSYFMYNFSADVVRDYLALGDESKLVANNIAAYRAYSNYAGSEQSLVDASFIRLKNVNLSYSLPSQWLNHVKLQNARLYVQGQNLLTITGYDGFDPESQGLVTPPLRTVIAGLQFTF
jgi:TonB-linked SusC/RagA family outer membrane protein